ncbi:hypothetical protein [Microbispora sp. CA-102843]|uniref:hypothetical protein n=1 Tax=Microbispora sp. CA-102843 TaxID=3239952 RepID=UPI003D902BF6
MSEQPPAPQQPSPAKHGALIAFGVVGVLVFFAVIGAIASSGSHDEQGPPIDVSTIGSNIPVFYDVTGTAAAVSLTVRTATGTEQASGASLPVHLSIPMSSGDFVYVSAQNAGESGTVSCSITVGGRVISSNESSGAFAIASCEGTVP